MVLPQRVMNHVQRFEEVDGHVVVGPLQLAHYRGPQALRSHLMDFGPVWYLPMVYAKVAACLRRGMRTSSEGTGYG